MSFGNKNIGQFFGIFSMVFFSWIHYMALRDVRDAFVVCNGGGAGMILPLKTVSYLFTCLAAIPILLLSRGGDVSKVLKIYFPLNALLLGGCSCLSFANSSLLSNPLFIKGFYLFSGASMVLSPALVWGCANQRYTFKKAAMLYPIIQLLCATLSTSVFVAFFHFSAQVASQNPFRAQAILLAIVATINLLALAVYRQMDRNCTDADVQENESKRPSMYFIVLGTMASIFIFLPDLMRCLFTCELRKMIPNVGDYNTFLSNHSASIKEWKFYAGIASCLIGVVLYFVGPKGFFSSVGLIGFGMLISGIIFLHGAKTKTIDQENLLSYVLFISLISIVDIFRELAYFGINQQHRFHAKIIAEVIVYSLSYPISWLLIGGIQVYGIVLQVVEPIVIIGAIVSLGGLYYVHQKLNEKRQLSALPIDRICLEPVQNL